MLQLITDIGGICSGFANCESYLRDVIRGNGARKNLKKDLLVQSRCSLAKATYCVPPTPQASPLHPSAVLPFSLHNYAPTNSLVSPNLGLESRVADLVDPLPRDILDTRQEGVLVLAAPVRVQAGKVEA